MNFFNQTTFNLMVFDLVEESPSVHKKIQYHLELYVICTNMLNRCSNASYHTYAQQENYGNRQIYERVCSFVRDVDSH